MPDIIVDEAVIKAPRPDERREITDSAFRTILNAELVARQEKTRRLRQARIALMADSAGRG
jgi:hypothetical protein